MKYKEELLFIIYFIICIVTILLYGQYKCNNPYFKDPLRNSLGLWDLNGWSLTHLLFYTLIGYTFKSNYLVYAFLLGCLWELFEYYYGEKRPGWLDGYGDCNMKTNKLDGRWWYGKWSDILINTLGLFLGAYIRNKKFSKLLKV